MSWIQGHPILADIRAGFKLRPTVTVDKSKPIIQAEDEDVPTVKFEEPKNKPPIDLALLCGPKTERPKVTSTCRVPTDALNIRSRNAAHTVGAPPPPPSGAPPPFRASSKPITNPALLKLGKASGNVDRSALLNSIKGGFKLKKTITNDKSGLILDDEYLAEIGKQTFDERNTNGMENGAKVNGATTQSDSPKSKAKSPSPIRSSSPKPKEKVQARPALVPAKIIAPVKITNGIPPPPPPPPPMFSSFGSKAAASVSKPQDVKTNGIAPPPPPPPPMPPMSSQNVKAVQSASRQPSQQTKPTYRPAPSREPEAPKKSDAVFDDKDLYVTREKLQSEIPKGSAAARIQMLKQMEQNSNGVVPMPKASHLPGRLKIIETTPPDAPRLDSRLKIHDGEISSKPAASTENGKLRTATPKKFNVPITVKTDDEPSSATEKSTVKRKMSKTGEKKKTTTTKSTLSPSNAQDSAISPNSTPRSSAYASAASSPTSISSLSPKSKSSGVSSASSVSPPIRKSTESAERFRELRKSLDERVAAAESESGARFWKSAVKSNGADSKSNGQSVEIKNAMEAENIHYSHCNNHIKCINKSATSSSQKTNSRFDSFSQLPN
ncbi:hypothetical protein M3Y98_00600400 [Aphelenchoides besseyi]|nr:hypothetical protein M3Y98_00600400 [Aphelenchoides besseyi]